MIRETRLLIALATGLMTTMAPLVIAHAQDTASAEKEVAAVEEAYSQSFVTGDPSIAQRYLSDDFVGLEADGKTLDKALILKDVTSEPRPKVLRIPAIIVKIHGDTAIALGTEVDEMPGTSKLVHRRWLDTLRRTPEGWRLVASGEMVLPTP